MRYDICEPYISSDTMYLHFEKHYKGYINKYKKLIENTQYENMPLEKSIKLVLQKNDNIKIVQNANQIINHHFFFKGLKCNVQMSNFLIHLININFGSIEKFKNNLKNAVLNHFSNGWVWILFQSNKIIIKDTHDDASFLYDAYNRPLFVIDIWEHAYYLDNFNDRSKYFENIWNCINWNFIEYRYKLFSN